MQAFSRGAELDYPVDHERTTRQHAGESLKNGANAPGLAGLAVAVVALIIGLYALAMGSVAVGSVALILAVVSGSVGSAWLVYAHRRVRIAELHWRATHSDEPAPPPSS
jgi:hypothetical protein